MSTRAAALLAGAGLLAGCAPAPDPTADIGRIAGLKSDFGPEFRVTEVAPTGIDPRVLAGQRLPDGMKFEPTGCAEFAAGQLVPPGTKGNMAAVSAEGAGNRFIVIALETNEPVPVLEPGSDCATVSFTGGAMRGTVQTVEVPAVDGATTIGVRRVVQTTIDGMPRTGEVYNYSAHFGVYQVIVSANPLVLPGKPVAPVDIARARDLLVAGAAAIRG